MAEAESPIKNLTKSDRVVRVVGQVAHHAGTENPQWPIKVNVYDGYRVVRNGPKAVTIKCPKRASGLRSSNSSFKHAELAEGASSVVNGTEWVFAPEGQEDKWVEHIALKVAESMKARVARDKDQGYHSEYSEDSPVYVSSRIEYRDKVQEWLDAGMPVSVNGEIRTFGIAKVSKQFVCPHCGKSYASRQGRYNHIRKQH